MMDAALENLNSPNYAYHTFPNIGKNVDNISEGISSHNSSDNGREESFNDFLVNFNEVLSITSLITCIFGAVGNGIVIWLLGFRIKRNPFMTYILNLAIADFVVLLSDIPEISTSYMFISPFVLDVSFYLFLLMYSASQFFLMAVSIDRCVAIFLPLWHRCHRPPCLSTIVCALIWVLSVLLTAITYTLRSLKLNVTIFENSFQLIVNAVLCLPVITIATMALFIKVCLKARQHRRGRLLTIVLLTLLFFLLFAFPYNIMYILSDFIYLPVSMGYVAVLLADLNSSVNPVIYFLVGRQWKSRHREGMKMILQKVFQEEECGVEETTVETQV